MPDRYILIPCLPFPLPLQEAALYVQEGEANDNFLSHPTGKWSRRAYKILHHPVFHVFDLLLCTALILLALIERPAIFAADTYVVTVRPVGKRGLASESEDIHLDLIIVSTQAS